MSPPVAGGGDYNELGAVKVTPWPLPRNPPSPVWHRNGGETYDALSREFLQFLDQTRAFSPRKTRDRSDNFGS